MRFRALALVIAGGVLALTGCSSSSGSDDDPATAPPSASGTSGSPAAAPAADGGKAALTAAVRAYSAAYFKPDPDAAGKLLSARCRSQTSADAYRAALTQAVATYGHQAVKSVTVDSLSGDMARVTYTYAVPALDQQGQPWVREGGAWHYDAC